MKQCYDRSWEPLIEPINLNKTWDRYYERWVSWRDLAFCGHDITVHSAVHEHWMGDATTIAVAAPHPYPVSCALDLVLRYMRHSD